MIKEELTQLKAIKFKLIIACNFLTVQEEIKKYYSHTDIEMLHSILNFSESYNILTNYLNLKISNLIQNQSIQKFISIDYMDVHLFKIDSLNGSSLVN